MEYSGKRNDVVDFGGEVDYSNYTWFQDAPQRAPVSTHCTILQKLMSE